MRFMVLVPANKESEAGILPPKELFEAMGKFNEELVKAGVILAGDGLQPTSKGARVRFSDGKTTVLDGPFPETKELVAGYWVWKVNSKQEAIEWLKKAPFADCEVELRQIYELDDFSEAMTPELRRQELCLRAETEQLAKGSK